MKYLTMYLLIFLLLFANCTVKVSEKENIEISKSFFHYNDDLFILHLYLEELPLKMQNLENISQDLTRVYVESDNMLVNAYSNPSNNFECFFIDDKIIIECHDVLVFPDKVILILGYARLEIYLSDTEIVGFEFNNPRFR